MSAPAYVTRDQLEAVIPPQLIPKALDDDNDGQEDDGVWDGIVVTVTRRINGFLVGRYDLPFPSVPDLVASAALIFAAEIIYDRNGFSNEQNPWAARAKEELRRLEKIADGTLGLGDEYDPAHSGGLVSEPSKTHRTDGRLMV